MKSKDDVRFGSHITLSQVSESQLEAAIQSLVGSTDNPTLLRFNCERMTTMRQALKEFAQKFEDPVFSMGLDQVSDALSSMDNDYFPDSDAIVILMSNAHDLLVDEDATELRELAAILDSAGDFLNQTS